MKCAVNSPQHGTLLSPMLQPFQNPKHTWHHRDMQRLCNDLKDLGYLGTHKYKTNYSQQQHRTYIEWKGLTLAFGFDMETFWK
jgi:hypothetical protein